MLKMPSVPSETPTPMPILRFVLFVVFTGPEDGAGVAIAVVWGGRDVEVEDDIVVAAGTQFQPFIWMPVAVVATAAVDIVVTHAEAISFEFLTVAYVTRLICCPAVMGDRHSGP
jgi:hypothetical protein